MTHLQKLNLKKLGLAATIVSPETRLLEKQNYPTTVFICPNKSRSKQKDNPTNLQYPKPEKQSADNVLKLSTILCLSKLKQVNAKKKFYRPVILLSQKRTCNLNVFQQNTLVHLKWTKRHMFHEYHKEKLYGFLRYLYLSLHY